jgi:prevent-host-death family protein
MKTATVRELRNNYTKLLRWVRAGGEIVITQRGSPVARLVPEKGAKSKMVNWADSPALARDRKGERKLSAEESARLLEESRGQW